jgi:hypothetical protein
MMNGRVQEKPNDFIKVFDKKPRRPNSLDRHFVH